MTETITSSPARTGEDVPTLDATLEPVRTSPQTADSQSRRNTWVSRTPNRATIHGCYGAGQDNNRRTESFVHDADPPAVLVDANHGPTPVEFLLHAIAACLAAGLANSAAAARGITMHRVGSTVEGELDLLDVLGLDSDGRNRWRHIRVSFTVDGDATPEQLGALSDTVREMGRNPPRVRAP